MHKNINLLLKRIENSQESLINIAEANRIQNAERHITVFYGDILVPPINTNIGLFNLERGLHQKGLTIANCLDTGRYLKSCIADKKVIYIWELEWMFEPMNYEINVQTLQNADFIFCESKEYAAAIKNYSNVDAILSAFNLENINEICYR